MKLVSLNCPSCGAQLDVDADKGHAFCTYCGAKILVDDEVQRVEHTVRYDNAEDAGYQFEKGRQRAMAETGQQTAVASIDVPQPAPKKRRTFLWVLGWIFIFPVPLTILIMRKKNLKPVVRYGIIAAAWLVYAIWMGSSGRSSRKPKVQDTGSDAVATQSEVDPEGQEAEAE